MSGVCELRTAAFETRSGRNLLIGIFLGGKGSVVAGKEAARALEARLPFVFDPVCDFYDVWISRTPEQYLGNGLTRIHQRRGARVFTTNDSRKRSKKRTPCEWKGKAKNELKVLVGLFCDPTLLDS